MGIEAAPAIRALLEPRLRKRRALDRWLWRLLLAMPLVYLVGLLVLFWFLPSVSRGNRSAASMIGMAVFGGIPQLVMGVSLAFTGAKAEVAALLRIDDRRVIPILLDVRAYSGEEQKRSIRTQLIRLLASLQATDCALLDAEHRAKLHEAMAYCDNRLLGGKLDTEYILAVLAALQQIGDHTSLPIVERLAKSAVNPRIREATQECLPSLLDRDTRQGQTLLHPAMKPEAAADELLRAAASVAETESALLLRAGRCSDVEKDTP